MFDVLHHLHLVFGHAFLGALLFVWWSFDKNDTPNGCRQKVLGNAIPFYLTFIVIMHASGVYMLYNEVEIKTLKIVFVAIFDGLFLWALSFHYLYKKLPMNALLIRKGLILSLVIMVVLGHI